MRRRSSVLMASLLVMSSSASSIVRLDVNNVPMACRVEGCFLVCNMDHVITNVCVHFGVANTSTCALNECILSCGHTHLTICAPQRLKGTPRRLSLSVPTHRALGATIFDAGAPPLWPHGQICYKMDPDVNATAIYEAMAVWEASTPLRFLPCQSTSDACCDPCGDYVHIQGGSGCYASLGYVAGACAYGGQALVLGPACSTGNIIHELGHTVGLVHEHQRADRDDYVKIYLENVDPVHAPDFAKGSILAHGSTVSIVSLWSSTDNYDYDSIMHYGLHDFSINQLQTLLPITRVGDRDSVREDLFGRLGQRHRLSAGDVQAIAELYGRDDVSST